jgi:methionyl-tRNA formyltransferase
MRVLIIGRTEMLYDTARVLAESQHVICGIVTAPASAEYTRKENDFKRLANELDCPFLCASRLDQSALEFIKRIEPQIAISINWVSVIHKEIFDWIPGGILNAHFGDLPRYRGNAVINWAILRHEPEIVLSIHFMEPEYLDSGDIVLQKKMTLSNETTIKNILEFASENVPAMYLDALSSLESGNYSLINQDEVNKTAFRCYPRISLDSKIDWNQSAVDIDALIRASTYPYCGAYTYLRIDQQIRKVIIWESHVVSENTQDVGTPGHIIKNDSNTGESWVYTGQGILGLKKIQYIGEPECSPGRLWKSIRLRFGLDMEEELMEIYRRIS